MTELADVDELAGEVQTAVSTVEALSTAVDDLKAWLSTLPDRWAGAAWTTEGLDTAIQGVSDGAAALKIPDEVLEQLLALEAAIATARPLGEVAAEAGATGDLSGFAPSQPPAARRARRAAGVVDAAPAVPAGTGDRLEARIRDAYRALSAESGSPWVGLAALRNYLVDVPRAQLDPALQQLSRQPGVHVQAEANQQALTEADREAAVTFGGSDRHILQIEGSGRRSRAARSELGDQ